MKHLAYKQIFCFYVTLIIIINTFVVASNGTILFATNLIFSTFKGLTGEHSSFTGAFLFTLSSNYCLTRLQNNILVGKTKSYNLITISKNKPKKQKTDQTDSHLVKRPIYMTTTAIYSPTFTSIKQKAIITLTSFLTQWAFL